MLQLATNMYTIVKYFIDLKCSSKTATVTITIIIHFYKPKSQKLYTF